MALEEQLDDLRLDDPGLPSTCWTGAPSKRLGKVRRSSSMPRSADLARFARDAKVREIQSDQGVEKDARAGRIEAERASTDAAASSLNDRFLAGLARDLAPAQVETVKDKMTYHKLQVTYNGYLEMLPRLTSEQKQVVFDMLKQARDEAVYAGSAEEKTAIFGRYKGRVNNYLSSEGYDLKLASKEWAERRKAAGK